MPERRHDLECMTLSVQLAALAAELDAVRHPFEPHPSGADCCAAVPSGWPAGQVPPSFALCGAPAAWTVHRTAEVVMREALT